MRIYHCDRKVLLRFHNQGAKFVKDYSTNYLNSPKNSFVDAKGRVVAVFDQHKLSDDEVWVIMEKSCVGRLMNHLYKYLYLTDAKADADESKLIYWDLDNDFSELEEGDIVIPQSAGKLIVTGRKLEADVSGDDMTKFRIANGIPWQGVDFNDELLLCVGDEEYVSYLKGCYLGQEVIARVHYKGKPPKKLVVKMLRDCDADQRMSMTSRTMDPASGDYIGFVFDKCVKDV